MAVGGTCLLPPLSSGGASVSTLTGSAEAVTRLRLPQIVACGFPALRFPVRFAPRLMGPILLGRLSSVAAEPCSC